MKNKELFLISLSIFLTIIAWLIFDIYEIKKNMKKKYQLEYQSERVKEFNLDLNVLKDLKKKNKYD